MSEATLLYAISGLSLALAAWSLVTARRLKGEIEEARHEALSIRKHVTKSLEAMKGDILRAVSLEIRASRTEEEGGKVFHAGMTVGEALALHPLAGEVLAQFQLGGCSGCDIRDDHILGDAAREYGIDLPSLLASLNGLLDGTTVVPKERVSEVSFVNMRSRSKDS